MGLTPRERALRAAARFPMSGPLEVVGPLAGGLIHETWLVRSGAAQWVLQELNRAVFPDVDGVMANLAAVSAHLIKRLTHEAAPEVERRALALVRTVDGRPYATDEDGGAWRCTRYITGTVTHQVAPTPAEAREAGRAFGEFTRLVADLRAPLAVTIPGFHDTPARLAALERAAAADRAGRRWAVAAELEVIREQAALAPIIPSYLAAGELPTRAAHNDAKIGNVLFDAAGGHALAVLDLDTVMPGSALHDVGDLIRSASGTAAEDEPDPARMRVDAARFGAVVAGWFAGAGTVLTPLERSLTLTAGRVITFEQAVRFLTDHLEGDRYYPIARPGHNLDRARAQLALLLDLTAREDELEEIVARA
ncbi:MAG TPA: aminoglycoside phosphotransferase family protein [Gemmatimonadales bacterium]|nr:aminoglycoside phosphotransferase family protein [Gemmatimonadales bacterium]